MTIGSDSAIEFFGTKDSQGSSAASVSDGAFSVAGDVSEWTNDDDAIYASIVLEATWSVAPDANSSVALFAQLNDIESTNDMDAPTSNYEHVSLGEFPVKNITTAQYIPIVITLPNVVTSQKYQFFIKNNTGQTISASWDLHITPKAIGPHA